MLKEKIIIAEIGSTHDGSLKLAKKSIELASKCGADAVKFQMHIPEEETLKNAPSPKYFNKEPRFEYFKRTGFTFNQWKKLVSHCKKNKVEFMCSPFSSKAVDILEKLNVKRYKIPSGELTNLPMLEKIAKTDKKVLLSTGMSNWNEIKNAVLKFKKKKFNCFALFLGISMFFKKCWFKYFQSNKSENKV